MISRALIRFRLASTLFKPALSTLPTPFSSSPAFSPRKGSSSLALLYEDYNPTIESFNSSVYQNRIKSVKNDFDNSNIVEAQESISKITSDLEGLAYLHSSDSSYISTLTNAYFYKGICFSKGGLDDKENAMQAFNKALVLNPNHEQAKLGLRKVELSFGVDSKGLPIARKFK